MPSENESKHQKKLEFNDQYVTYDLGLSAVLVSLGYELWNIEKSNPRKAQFIFKRDKGIDESANDYWLDRLKINARTLIDNQKMLKNRIYSE